jgi:hypothetical protein
MGMSQSAYFAYGIQIPETSPGVLEETELGDAVNFLHAGGYDRDMTFLVTECVEARLGERKTVTPQSFDGHTRAFWDEQLHKAALLLGVPEMPEPGWFVVPDVS